MHWPLVGVVCHWPLVAMWCVTGYWWPLVGVVYVSPIAQYITLQNKVSYNTNVVYSKCFTYDYVYACMCILSNRGAECVKVH